MKGSSPIGLAPSERFQRANRAGTTCFRPSSNDQRGRHNIAAVVIAVNNRLLIAAGERMTRIGSASSIQSTILRWIRSWFLETLISLNRAYYQIIWGWFDRILNIGISILVALLKINKVLFRYKIFIINILMLNLLTLLLYNKIINEITFKLCSVSFRVYYFYSLNRRIVIYLQICEIRHSNYKYIYVEDFIYIYFIM